VVLPSFHLYVRLEPVATTERVKLPPAATSVSACGWVVMTGATMVTPLLEEELDELLELELELLDDELLELDEELEELDELLDAESVTAAILLVAEPPLLVTTTV